MTTLKQLNVLARECQRCALEDTRSINQHLKECNTCWDYHEKAEMFNQTLKDIRNIALQPEDSRHRELHERMSRMANMEDDERKEALGGLMDAISMLPEKEKIELVRTRTEIIFDFPSYERKPVIKTLSELSGEWDAERKRGERNSLAKATDDLPVLKRMVVWNLFEKMLQ